MIGTTLTHYRITAKLGEGGMGEVYRATDTKLGREVAIKVLPANISRHAQSLTRFEREAKALAALNHPHIAGIYGFDADQGTHFLVLELVEGETLRERLRRGPLPPREALAVARQIAEAIQEAHAKGIIHRDLKPGNVKITPNGRVKVLDFGLAKMEQAVRGEAEPATAPGADADALTLPADRTQPGAVMGTPAYMSPEQARGLEVDKRTDIWAFGCCLFECLSGRKPFEGKTTSDLMAAVLKSEPNWDLLPEETPAEVLTLLRRCLEKEPPRRLSSMGDIALTLEETARSVAAPVGASSSRRTLPASWLRPTITGGLVVLLVLAGALLWISRSGKRSATPTPGTSRQASNSASKSLAGASETPKSIAVLPFVSMSADKTDEYLSDGMTEELLNVLAKVPGLRVPGRSSCFAFKGKNEENIFRKVGEQLHVTTVLEGSVRKAGEKLRITAQLINVADGFQLWQETYDKEMKDILSVQSDVARRVAQALQVQLGVETTRALAKAATEDPEAHRLYLLGRHYALKVTDEDNATAIEYFQQALKVDPNYARAYCGLADTWDIRLTPKEMIPAVRALADTALRLDPELAEAHCSKAWILMEGDWDFAGAEREFAQAIKLNPNLAYAYDGYGWPLMFQGRFQEAEAAQKKAVDLEPLAAYTSTDLAFVYECAREFDKSVELAKQAVDLDPRHPWAYHVLGWSLLHQGKPREAIPHFEQVRKLGENPMFRMSLGCAYAAIGERAKAEAVIKELDDLAKQRYVPASAQAYIWTYLNEKDRALTQLERSVVERDPTCVWFKVDPAFDRLRNEPRFQAVLHQIGFHE